MWIGFKTSISCVWAPNYFNGLNQSWLVCCSLTVQTDLLAVLQRCAWWSKLKTTCLNQLHLHTPVYRYKAWTIAYTYIYRSFNVHWLQRQSPWSTVAWSKMYGPGNNNKRVDKVLFLFLQFICWPCLQKKKTLQPNPVSLPSHYHDPTTTTTSSWWLQWKCKCLETVSVLPCNSVMAQFKSFQTLQNNISYHITYKILSLSSRALR